MDSLNSFMYCTPVVLSAKMLAPWFSGPKHQIFKASFLSQSKSSFNFLALDLTSSLNETSPFSMASGNFSCKGCALAYNLLCLFGDLAMTCWVDSVVEVSLKVTIGSLLTISH